ncbi:hypothetical protein HOL21_04220 [Candidatus Woesearchaeota archaeon]|jgi:hypothetical protein|nr:hypothetical protein [Candidatus Woesearchaeota archaeon]MBT5397392.1 hypothetical protein [Candidatus Woesearchaeota archaeon]MBT5924340.1 hypothetical protein [Candidatus Woesearchaeota archaeon]MBT6367762.1 hypothetical protein [Candidatus Woesearchaeota archaeon]MBT7762792.1 hypothetical protein [Candidatus Woesearchaeota archaeon]
MNKESKITLLDLERRLQDFAGFLEDLRIDDGRQEEGWRDKQITDAFDAAYIHVAEAFYRRFPEYRTEHRKKNY